MNNQNNISLQSKFFTLDEDLVWDSGIGDKNFISSDYPNFKIVNGVWYIPKGTQWDGTSNVPNGPEDPNKPGFPITWKASLIHDLGCESWYYKCFPYQRRRIDRFFFQLLKEDKFEYRKLYYLGVMCYGFLMEFLYWSILSKKSC